MAAALKSRHRTPGRNARRYDARIVRDANGRVVDGREAFMANLMAAEYAKDKNTSPENLADRVWAQFVAESRSVAAARAAIRSGGGN